MSGVYRDQNDLIMGHKRVKQTIEEKREIKASKTEVEEKMC